MKMLEERFDQPVRVKKTCVEELAPGPKWAYGDNIGLLNFSENLNAATRILEGHFEREECVATNLRGIVNRLPNDLILWQVANGELRACDVLKIRSIENHPRVRFSKFRPPIPFKQERS